VEYAIVPDDDFKAQGKQRARESELFIWVIQPTGDVAFRRVDLKPLWQKALTLSDVVRVARCLTPGADCGASAQKIRELGIGDALPASESTQHQSPSATADSRGATGSRRLRLYPGLRKLHQILIEPIADLLPRNPTARIIFIPQASLFLVPFVALQDANGKYLIENHTLSTAPAIQVLELTQRQRERHRAENRGTEHRGRGTIDSSYTPHRSTERSRRSPTPFTLIVGNPTMPLVSAEPGQPPEPLSPLPGAEKEAIAIAQLLGTKAIIGNQATKVSILKKLPEARLVHFATHGLLEYGSRSSSLEGLGIPGAIALAPSRNDDGLLTTSDVLNLRLRAELVTLSACDTGQGRITGDGVVGLSRAFISAGVPSVVVSLWAVPDAATAKLMTTFYSTLQQQPDKAQALRQAMLTTMKNYPYPIEWAAFTLIGEAE
jgi:CHAT domain-containing protein